jgi:hypothetical protein
MRKRLQIALAVLLVAVAGVIVWQVLRLRGPGYRGGGWSPTANAVAMTFVGYTNPPGNRLRFALFSVSNQAPYTVRWRGNWVEVEGNPSHWARTVNPSLPGYTFASVLKVGESLRLAVGEPSNASETGRWRLAMSFSRYTWRERWLDLSLRHNLPLELGPIVMADAQRILNPSNSVTVTTAWLTQ